MQPVATPGAIVILTLIFCSIVAVFYKLNESVSKGVGGIFFNNRKHKEYTDDIFYVKTFFWWVCIWVLYGMLLGAIDYFASFSRKDIPVIELLLRGYLGTLFIVGLIVLTRHIPRLNKIKYRFTHRESKALVITTFPFMLTIFLVELNNFLTNQ